MGGVNKYWIDKENGDDGNVNGDRNEGGEEAADILSIDNAAVRESHIRRLGKLRSSRYNN